MTDPLADVSFPIQGSGSTPPVRGRMPLHLLDLSGCTIDRRWSKPDLTAPTWRLYLNLDDGAAAVVRGRSIPLAAGHLFIIPAWLRWSSHCERPVRHYNAMFDLPALPRERVASLCREVVRLATPDAPLARLWLDCALAQAAAGQTGPALQAQGHAAVWAALARYFALLGPEAADRLHPGERDGWLEDLRRWSEERLDQPLPRAALARAAGCSEAELGRRFAARHGTSPARWLRERRVARAAALLRGSDLPIEAVATRCGLGDRSRFSKTFAAVIGCGPATYRRSRR